MRANFEVGRWFVNVETNRYMAAVYALRAGQLMQAEPRYEAFIARHESVAKAVAEREDTFNTLLQEADLFDTLKEAGSEVVDAVIATQGRLAASAARPHLVTALTRVPALASALSSRHDVAADDVTWTQLLSDEALLEQLTVHPGLVGTVVADAQVGETVMAAPGFIATLAGVEEGVRRLLTTEGVLRLVRQNPGLARGHGAQRRLACCCDRAAGPERHAGRAAAGAGGSARAS